MAEQATFGEVVETTPLTPNMVRVVFGGAGLDRFEPTPWTDQYVNALFLPADAGYDVPFDVDEARRAPVGRRPVGRRFTVRRWDPDERLLTMDFVVHGDVGHAGRWAARARPGDRLQVLGPNGSYAPDPEADCHLMIGDESAIPAVAASLEAVGGHRPVKAVLLVESPAHELELPCDEALDVTWVHRAAAGGDRDQLLHVVEGMRLDPGRLDVFVHGEASEVRAIRRHLVAERGIPAEGASISPYWRRGQDDEQWRKVKADWLAESDRELTGPPPR